jgi:tryptophan 2,3-dioxygenase
MAVRRVNALVKIVTGQLSALETLPPQRFAEFRGYLGTSSGSQSTQFRAIEAVSGMRGEHFMKAIEAHGPVAPEIQRALDRPTLQELLMKLLDKRRVTLQQVYSDAKHGERALDQRVVDLEGHGRSFWKVRWKGYASQRNSKGMISEARSTCRPRAIPA